MNNEFKSLRDKVLAKISKEHVSPHSRAYFAAKIAVLAVIAFAVLAISVFLCNFIFFAIQASGSNHLLGFGNRGLQLFIRVFPWWLLVIDIGLVVILEALLRRFRFGYKSPVLYLLFGLAIVTISIAYTVDRATPFNDFLRDRAHEHRLPPPLNDIYERSGELPGGPDGGLCRCTITAIQGNIIQADDIDVGTTTHLTIILPQNDERATSTGLTVGDVVFIAGDRDGGTLRAYGIQKLPPGSPSIAPYGHQNGHGDGDDRP